MYVCTEKYHWCVCFCSMMRIEFNFITTRNSFGVNCRKRIKTVV